MNRFRVILSLVDIAKSSDEDLGIAALKALSILATIDDNKRSVKDSSLQLIMEIIYKKENEKLVSAAVSVLEEIVKVSILFLF